MSITFKMPTKDKAKAKARENIKITGQVELPPHIVWACNMPLYDLDATSITKTGVYCVVCNVSYKKLTDTAYECQCYDVYHNGCGQYYNISKYPQKPMAFADCHHCPKCCPCPRCGKCGIKITYDRNIPNSLYSKIHKGCNWCKKCCKCTDCSTCGKSMSGVGCVCDTDGKHHSHCCLSTQRIKHAAESSQLLYVERKPTFHAATTFRENRSRRYLSIESEVDTCRFGNSVEDQVPIVIEFMELLKKWKHGLVKDASFTCPPGFEVNMAPACGDRFVEAVVELQGMYEKMNATTSWSTGMHVHVDARDFFYEDLVNLIHTYAKVEFALFSMLPPHRRLSKYATPCSQTLLQAAAGGYIRTLKNPMKNKEEMILKSTVALTLAKRLYGDTHTYHAKTSADVKRVCNQDIRYSALNVHSWFRMKTFEFRLHQGSTSLVDMLLWPQVLASVVEYAKRTPIAKIKDLPDNPLAALFIILKPSSYTNPKLSSYVADKVSRNSPDYEQIWPTCVKWGTSVPFKPPSSLVMGFDATNRYYTIMPSRNYGGHDNVLWTPATGSRGADYELKFATQLDMLDPGLKGVAYLAPEGFGQVKPQKVPEALRVDWSDPPQSVRGAPSAAARLRLQQLRAQLGSDQVVVTTSSNTFYEEPSRWYNSSMPIDPLPLDDEDIESDEE